MYVCMYVLYKIKNYEAPYSVLNAYYTGKNCFDYFVLWNYLISAPKPLECAFKS